MNTGITTSTLGKIIFYIIVIDVLFLPYASFLAINYTLPFVFPIVCTFLIRNRGAIDTVEVRCFIVYAIFVVISTIYSLSSEEVIRFGSIVEGENLKRAAQQIFVLSYYFYFFYLLKRHQEGINLKPLLYVFFAYVVLWGVLYVYDIDTYTTYVQSFNPYESSISRYIAGENSLRFSFIWSDPNNIGYAMSGLYLFILTHYKPTTITTSLLLAGLVFIGIICMSTGAWMTIGLLCIPLTILHFFRRSTGLTTKIAIIFVMVAGILLLFQTLQSNDQELLVRAYERYEGTKSSSASGRMEIWSRIFEDKIDSIAKNLLIGNGYQMIVDGKLVQTHSGHIQLFLGFGLPAYLCFMYIVFRKRRDESWLNWIIVVPFLVCFTINTMIGEAKLFEFYLLLLAYTRSLTISSNTVTRRHRVTKHL